MQTSLHDQKVVWIIYIYSFTVHTYRCVCSYVRIFIYIYIQAVFQRMFIPRYTSTCAHSTWTSAPVCAPLHACTILTSWLYRMFCCIIDWRLWVWSAPSDKQVDTWCRLDSSRGLYACLQGGFWPPVECWWFSPDNPQQSILRMLLKRWRKGWRAFGRKERSRRCKVEVTEVARVFRGLQVQIRPSVLVAMSDYTCKPYIILCSHLSGSFRHTKDKQLGICKCCGSCCGFHHVETCCAEVWMILK